MRVRRWQILTARLLFLAYLLFTASYCLLCYIPFSYQQVHVGELLPWVTRLAHLHSFLFWPALASALFTIRPDLKAGASRYLARGFAGTGLIVGTALLVHPLLPGLTNDGSSLRWCLLSLLPLLWLAIIDWIHGNPEFTWTAATSADSSRVFLASVQTAVYLAVIYFAVGIFRISNNKHLSLNFSQQAWVLLWTLVSHLLLLLLVFVLVDLISRIAVVLGELWQVKANILGSTLFMAVLPALVLRYVIFPS